MQPSSNMLRGLALMALVAALAGCSEYLDRRETISLGGGNSIASNKIVQMADPWPRASADRNIAFNGAKMESAMERYRTNRVIQPRGIDTSANYQQPQGANDQNNTAPVGPTVSQSAAPVK
jgi:hypothetical protein